METQTRARHRLGGRHSDPIIVPGNQQKKPSGRRSAVLNPLPETTALVIPPMPDRAPRVVIREVDDDDTMDVPAITVASTPITVAWHKTALTAMAAIATGGLLLISGGSGSTAVHATAKTDKTGKHSAASDLELEDAEPHPITAQVTAILDQEKVDVTTVAAPKPVAPAPVVAAAPRHLAPTPAAVVPPKPAIATTTPAAPAPPPVAAASSGKGMAIAQGAIRQIGMMQDCTALASNSLGAAGMNVPRRWPWEYASLGTNVGLANAQPGDLLLYAAQNGMPAHIGVYIGNGRAVHGGWNGNQTVEWSTTVGQPGFGPYAAIRVA